MEISLTTKTLEQQLLTACLLEAMAPKAGNVHPTASFDDLYFADFVTSANVVAPVLAKAERVGVGQTILDAALATSKAVHTNTNLGILLLLAPLAAVPPNVSLTQGIKKVLLKLAMNDTRLIYDTIRIVHPGGLGDASEQDVADAPSVSILEAMRISAERDFIAKQYVNNFSEVLDFGITTFLDWTQRTDDDLTAIVGLQLSLLAAWPDSLIARKNGIPLAQEASNVAQCVLDTNWPNGTDSQAAFSQFDAWLRADGHQRNPGTTADLVAAILFAAIRDHHWRPRLGSVEN